MILTLILTTMICGVWWGRPSCREGEEDVKVSHCIVINVPFAMD